MKNKLIYLIPLFILFGSPWTTYLVSKNIELTGLTGVGGPSVFFAVMLQIVAGASFFVVQIIQFETSRK